jgi:hypothetical protein
VRDLNGDGYPELLLGQRGGGLLIFKGKAYTIGLPEESVRAEKTLKVWPNPAQHSFWMAGASGTWEVLHSTGQQMATGHASIEPIEVPLGHWPAGLYLVRVGNQTERLLVLP